MPIAAAGQPTTQEPHVYSQLPAIPDNVTVQKRSTRCEDTGILSQPQQADYGAAEGGRGTGRHSHTGRHSLAQGSSSPSQSPPTPSPFTSSYNHPQAPAMDPPRTRSRSRSGFYQHSMNSGGNNNINSGINTSGGISSASHQQHNPGRLPHGAHSPTENPRTPGNNLPVGAHRHTGPGAHRHLSAASSEALFVHSL
ncbi:hypothetical protein JZ751_006114 [Albula glossodonta]|uniref:Uncharacterized protein n=1 Tax=Albula glossodonta TaxID=121402 RepID=A0A8T2PEK5_9TELE|nr:hypothetical protein JZ751_006114 [Albula glossodonta]